MHVRQNNKKSTINLVREKKSLQRDNMKGWHDSLIFFFYFGINSSNNSECLLYFDTFWASQEEHYNCHIGSSRTHGTQRIFATCPWEFMTSPNLFSGLHIFRYGEVFCVPKEIKDFILDTLEQMGRVHSFQIPTVCQNPKCRILEHL